MELIIDYFYTHYEKILKWIIETKNQYYFIEYCFDENGNKTIILTMTIINKNGNEKNVPIEFDYMNGKILIWDKKIKNIKKSKYFNDIMNGIMFIMFETENIKYNPIY